QRVHYRRGLPGRRARLRLPRARLRRRLPPLPARDPLRGGVRALPRPDPERQVLRAEVKVLRKAAISRPAAERPAGRFRFCRRLSRRGWRLHGLERSRALNALPRFLAIKSSTRRSIESRASSLE